MTAAMFLPWIATSLLGGATADRFDRKRTMIVAALIRGAIVGLFGLTLMYGGAGLALAYLAAMALATLEPVYDSAAEALLPSLVSDNRLEKANGWLFATEMTSNQLLGVIMGGLIAAFSIESLFLVDAASFFVAGSILLTLPGTKTRRADVRASLVDDVKEGLVWLRQHRMLRNLASGLAITNATSGAVKGVLVLIALEQLGLDKTGFAFLLASWALGAVAGSGIASRMRERFRVDTVATGCMALWAGSMFVMASTGVPLLFGLALALDGAGAAVWSVVTISYRQREVPAHLRGRVSSVYRLLGIGAFPLGALLGGLIAGAFGLRAPLWLSAGVLVSSTIIFYARVRGPHATPVEV